MVYQTEDRAKLKKQHSDLAIQLAIQGRWEDAANVNRAIIQSFPSDVEAYNRLGKALTELGNYSEAQAAYSKCLELDPHNSIARKNLARLESLVETKAPAEGGQQKLPPQMFIEEMGKTGSTILVDVDMQTAARLAAGDQVYLRSHDSTLVVETGRGEKVGLLEPKLGQRLLKLMQGGNEYVAAITNVSDEEVKVFIRETYQDPGQAGKLSFPPTASEGFRPYVKERLLRQDQPSEDYYEEEGEAEDWEQEEAEVTIVDLEPSAGRDDFDIEEEE
ncbi:MAG TPA: tetratricopeptide repeat protein [Dehalococcoidia bacterium]|nr:tetratricopeptide repeat protein [Dehalococcoidia bacterium]